MNYKNFLFFNNYNLFIYIILSIIFEFISILTSYSFINIFIKNNIKMNSIIFLLAKIMNTLIPWFFNSIYLLDRSYRLEKMLIMNFIYTISFFIVNLNDISYQKNFIEIMFEIVSIMLLLSSIISFFSIIFDLKLINNQNFSINEIRYMIILLVIYGFFKYFIIKLMIYSLGTFRLIKVSNTFQLSTSGVSNYKDELNYILITSLFSMNMVFLICLKTLHT